MSGGRYNYAQDTLASELFSWSMSCTYGDEGRNQAKVARKLNPMGDHEVSELVWDVLCLIHSRDWCESGDTGEDTYQEDLNKFKAKWLHRTSDDAIESYRDDLLDYARKLADELQFPKDSIEVVDIGKQTAYNIY